MKKQLLLQQIRSAAKAAGITWELVRSGAEHDIWRCGTAQVSVPRHREINNMTAESIFKKLGDELGKDWWR